MRRALMMPPQNLDCGVFEAGNNGVIEANVYGHCVIVYM